MLELFKLIYVKKKTTPPPSNAGLPSVSNGKQLPPAFYKWQYEIISQQMSQFPFQNSFSALFLQQQNNKSPATMVRINPLSMK